MSSSLIPTWLQFSLIRLPSIRRYSHLRTLRPSKQREGPRRAKTAFLLHDLADAHTDGRFGRLLECFAPIDVLIVDDWARLHWPTVNAATFWKSVTSFD